MKSLVTGGTGFVGSHLIESLVERGDCLFHAFAKSLPFPLSPAVMKGPVVAHALRQKAGLPDDFVEALERYSLTDQRIEQDGSADAPRPSNESGPSENSPHPR